jgi:hypothetical protein
VCKKREDEVGGPKAPPAQQSKLTCGQLLVCLDEEAVLCHEGHRAVAVGDVAVLVSPLDDLVGERHPKAQVVQPLAHCLCILIAGVVLEHLLEKIVHLAGVAKVIHAPRGSHYIEELLDVELDACSGVVDVWGGGLKRGLAAGPLVSVCVCVCVCVCV